MRKIFTFLCALIACAGTMFAESVQIGDLYYNLNANDLTAEVTRMPSGEYTGDVIIPASVDYNSVPYIVTSIGSYAFNGYSNLTSISIPSSVTSIGDMAFLGCTGLTSITIPNSVTSIGSQAFASCIGLTSVEIPNSVGEIGMLAFSSCIGLTSVTIGNGVTSIGSRAFFNSSQLASVTINATTPPTLESKAFDKTAAALTIYVPAESEADYKGAWTAYADKIVAAAPADPNREYLSLDPSVWTWGYNSVPEAVEGGIKTTIISDWGALSMGWDPERDLSEWDKIVFEVSHMDGCAGEWFKLKAYLRDESDSEGKQMEGLLGLDAPDNELNYLVIDLHQQVEGFDLTKARVLAVQCEPTGGIFTISSAYLLKEEKPQPAEIGPREELNLGTDYPAGEHYQVLGEFSGPSWIGVGDINNETITVESLNGEIIDNITLEVYMPLHWTGYSIAATSGEVSGDVASYQDLVITNINATSVTLSRVGEGENGGSVLFSKIIVNEGSTTAIENVQSNKAQGAKVLRNGMLLIEKNGVVYNVLGAQVR